MLTLDTRTIQVYCRNNTNVLERQVNDSAHVTSHGYTEEEASTREQILRAATREFAEHGFRGASIRGIATAAGVSAGLVQHHFGTKDGLKQACDERVMFLLSDSQQMFLQRGMIPSDDEEIVARLDELQPTIDYLITSLSSGSESAAMWFRTITEYTHETLTSGRIGPALDPEKDDSWAIAATQTAMALGITAFYRTIQQALAIEDDTEMLIRVARARAVLASDRIISEETRSYLTNIIDQYAESKSTGKQPPENAASDGSGET
jgi:AcrR family transcriptional regulator